MSIGTYASCTGNISSELNIEVIAKTALHKYLCIVYLFLWLVFVECSVRVGLPSEKVQQLRSVLQLAEFLAK